MLSLKVIAVWVFMVMTAIANGGLRESILNRYFEQPYALATSGILLFVLLLGVIYLSIDLFVFTKDIHYLTLGLFWTGLTLSFEYGFGYFVRGLSFPEINQVFDFSSGNLFILALLATLFGPIALAYLKK